MWLEKFYDTVTLLALTCHKLVPLSRRTCKIHVLLQNESKNLSVPKIGLLHIPSFFVNREAQLYGELN